MNQHHATEITKVVVLVETSEGKAYQVPVSNSLRPLVVKLLANEQGNLHGAEVRPVKFEFITKV